MVDSHVRDVLNALHSRSAMALEACGLAMEGYAQDICPVRTGNLRNSITHAASDDTAIVGTNTEYAPYVELGTTKQKAQPFLVPAVRDHTSTYKKIINNYLGN